MSDSSSSSPPRRPAVLCILDGWGLRDAAPDNAIAVADTPNWDRYMDISPNARLDCSGASVGLPDGQMGNSEVGHMNIGAGRIVKQDLVRIDQAVADGALADNPALKKLIAKVLDSGGVCHLMGMISPGGVHSHQAHMAALAGIICRAGVKVGIHAFLDGRDTPPKSAMEYVGKFINHVSGLSTLFIATVGGRYYAMDRDCRWDRVEKAYLAIAEAEGTPAEDPMKAVQASYDAAISDEFMIPAVIGDYPGMKDGDALLMANFRSDRVRQILAALTDTGFNGFGRERRVKFSALAGMAEYSDRLNRSFDALFSGPVLDDILGAVVSRAGMTQLRLAETEKYAHVTFFLNGGREREFPGEKRIMVPSPKVATYDLKPEMSAFEVTERLVAAVDSRAFDFIVVNYANGDMVGHSGNLSAAVKAAETVDTCLGRLETAVQAAGGVLMITADHGNLEKMADPVSGQNHTAHTTNQVPVVLLGVDAVNLRDGRLADVAPTMLDLLGLDKPSGMSGNSLIVDRLSGQ